jgi:hypothetical protein
MGEEMRLSGSQIVGLYCPRSPSTYSDEEWEFIDRAIVRMHDEELHTWNFIVQSTGIGDMTVKRRYTQATGKPPTDNPKGAHARLARRAHALKRDGMSADGIAQAMGVSWASVVSMLSDLPELYGRGVK